MSNRFIKKSLGSQIFDVINIIFIILFSFAMLYPFINQLALSFNDGTDAAMGGVYFWPRVFSYRSYTFVFENKSLLRGAYISLLRTVVGTVTSLFATGLLAYIVTLKNFSGRKFMRVLFLITMYFGGGLIPNYLLMMKLGLVNSFHVYWIPTLLNTYYMLIMSSYIQNIPDSLVESARMDGASELTTYFRIIVPVSVPVFACIAIFTAVNQWNSWFDVMLYNPGRRWDTLQIILNRLLNEVQGLQEIQDAQLLSQKYREMSPLTVRAATTMVVTLPIIIIYPFFQKYFVGGFTMGAVKG